MRLFFFIFCLFSICNAATIYTPNVISSLTAEAQGAFLEYQIVGVKGSKNSAGKYIPTMYQVKITATVFNTYAGSSSQNHYTDWWVASMPQIDGRILEIPPGVDMQFDAHHGYDGSVVKSFHVITPTVDQFNADYSVDDPNAPSSPTMKAESGSDELLRLQKAVEAASLALASAKNTVSNPNAENLARTAYNNAVQAYNALVNDPLDKVAEAVLTSNSAAANTQATTTKTNLNTTAAAQAAGSTGQAVTTSGQATVAAIDALKAQQAADNAKLLQALKSGGGSASSSAVDMSGVEGKIDTTNSKLDKVKESVDKISSGKVQMGDPSTLANDAVTAATGVGNDTSTALNKFSSTNSGMQPVQPSGNAPGINQGTPVPKIRIGAKEYDLDPANFIIDNGYLPLAYACRTTIAVLLLVAFYKYILGVMTTLLAGLFTSDGVSTSLTARVGWSLVVDATGEMSPARPIITIARTALFLTFLGGVVALIDTMCAYFLYGAPGIIQLPSVMTTNYSNLIALGGRGFYFINLFVPVLTVIYMPLHAAMAHAAVMAMYAVAKSQSAAAQSV